MHEKIDLTNGSPHFNLKLFAAPKYLRDRLLAEARRLDSIANSISLLDPYSCDDAVYTTPKTSEYFTDVSEITGRNLSQEDPS